MMKRPLCALMLACVMMLSACTTSSPPAPPSTVDVSRYPAILVHAADVVVVNAYHPPMTAPNVDHLFTTKPADAARALVAQQVKAAGVQDTLRITIETAAVTREALPVKKSLVGLFSTAPSEKLEGRIALRFELFDPATPDIIRGRASVTTAREKMLTNDASPADRDRAYHTLTQDMTDDLAAQIAKTIPGIFGRE